MEDVKFPTPVFAGDTLRAETTVVSLRESKSRPTQGIVTFEHRGFNQRDEEWSTAAGIALMMRQTGMRLRSLLFVPGRQRTQVRQGRRHAAPTR